MKQFDWEGVMPAITTQFDEVDSFYLDISQAKEMGFEAVEYVSQLYEHEIEKLGFDTVIDSLYHLSSKEGIKK